jgi:hypothetical protein
MEESGCGSVYESLPFEYKLTIGKHPTLCSLLHHQLLQKAFNGKYTQ